MPNLKNTSKKPLKKPSKKLKKLKKKPSKPIITNQNSDNSFFSNITSGLGWGVGIESGKQLFSSFSSLFENKSEIKQEPQILPNDQICISETNLLIECLKNKDISENCYELYNHLQNCLDNNKKI